MRTPDSIQFDTRKQFQVNDKKYVFYSLKALHKYGFNNIERLPFSIRILLENLLRHVDTDMVTEEDIVNLASWKPTMQKPQSIPFMQIGRAHV